MEIKIDRDIILKCLSHIQGVVEKKNTLPILANVLIEAFDNKIQISATELDIIITEKIDAEVIKEGSTTTTAQVLYDLIRKLPAGSSIHLNLQNDKRLKLISGKSDFNLTCLPASEFPILEDSIESDYLEIKSKHLLKLLNKTKFSISNDETRHYLNGIYLHKTEEDNSKLIAVATDGHRLSKTQITVEKDKKFHPVILPKKTIFEIINIISDEPDTPIKILSVRSKIKFIIKDIVLISKVIDGKFPDYEKVIPSDTRTEVLANVADFISAVDRIKSLSADRKGVIKINIENNKIRFFINDTSSGEGIEEISAVYEGDNLEIGFNSGYLMDIANCIQDENITLKPKDATSPIVIRDKKDLDSTYVVMPMRVV
jgi:DNA polymerase-3 subunit beta